MNATARLAVGALVAVIAVGGALYLFGPNRGIGSGGSTPTPTIPPPTPAPSPTATAQASLGPLDTSTWVTYTSARYGFSIGHPVGWTEHRADHDWIFTVDAADSSSPGGFTAWELFVAPDNSIGTSAWSVAVAPDTTAETWLQAYCPIAEKTSPCATIQGLTVPVSMDGHPGILVPFTDDTGAFILVNNRMYVVAIWRPESDPSVAPYGGAQRLLRAYLATMHLLPGGPAPSGTPAPS